MVLLCMTPLVVRAVAEARDIAEEELRELCLPTDPSLADPAVGNPVSHGQLIGLSKLLRKYADKVSEKDGEGTPVAYTLDSLLRGSTFYVPPPPPKKAPTPEYKALMERLRRDEEARAYDRMVNPRPASETMGPSPLAHLDPREADFEADDVSYEEVHRQIILIINILVSIVACSLFIWMAARHWSAPKRLGLSMGGSGVIAVAEVVIYNGYVRRIKEAKMKEKKKPEIKQIIESWVIDGSSQTKEVARSSAQEKVEDGVRYRKGKHR